MSYDELMRDMERALVAIDASKPYRYEPTTSLPALSPQMQAALDAEAEMVTSVVKRARSMASELDAARAQLHADDHRAWEALGRPEGTYDTTNVQRLCAEVERLRSRVGWLDHLDTPEGRAMHATEAVRVENEQLRADLREALELLRAHGEPPNWLRQAWLRREPGDDTTAFHTWSRRYGKLLAKHKETP